VHLAAASWSFEETALAILREGAIGRKRIKEVCQLLWCGIQHDLLFKQLIKKERKKGRPSFRLYDLLAGAENIGRSRLIELHRLRHEFARRRFDEEDRRELPDGEIGELMVRGATAGEGYWNQRGKSRRTFAGEWTHTGDKYLRDSDGYYHYCGRTDDMFKVSGMWVSPFEVETALASHEAVLEAAVIGKQDADGLVKPKAFIVLRNGYTANDGLLETLKAHVKERAGLWKYPRWIDVRLDLPRTATGKIQRYKLRELES